MSQAAVYGLLLVAVVLEVIGTTALQLSQQFSRMGPTAIVVACYAAAFYCLSLTLKSIPVGIAYAIWSALGIVLISSVGLVFFKQRLDVPAIVGLCLIISGVLVVNLFSKSVSH
ncbi:MULTISPECIES: SMR family transporter [Rhizobium]|uniref:QacE family quaternary ammonium compound efflux SMR transporter n=1 Tax=Rhizobium bangladeshense TaxID=1138189 RepID=A0ABS7LAM0_9HYPH|nr:MULTISPECIES: SMR family transporter [Rhizobium]MBX4866434.1 QacE family quaternary ammonium compound efflux SMR transporter [Rhizobium bangladeshense]MBX4873603.1 QacE family quaternary ammonium compound efflux SMR transporter [Rhizobium bangladeshense]MBX4885460.1 QacE family quaternary ammonium compound efflux SMR transporter [Rhizobium bangladeshense]MBX4888172.1 QacE family quaternary ammonium compound efflux SMR transporter [Rhizobium bangladeshense]MBX4894082.1 QacE family quaternary